MKPARSDSALPSALVVGMSHDTVAEPTGMRWTSRSNGASDAESVPSDTEIVTSTVVPICVSAGVPASAPVSSSNEAHAGALAIENVNVSPSGSLALGVNE